MEDLANAILKEDWEYYQGVTVQDEHKLLNGLLKNRNKSFNIEELPGVNHDDNDSNEMALGSSDAHEEDVQLLARKKCSPIAVHHLMEKRSQRMGFGCQVCAFEGRGRGNTRNVVVCSTHRLRLCTVSQPTKILLQEKGPQKGEEVIDYSWRAPNTETTCWEKAHKFYIPQGLFRNHVHEINGSDKSFQCCIVSSQLYNAKRLALGEEVVKRGRSSGGKIKETKNPNKRMAGKQKQQSNSRSVRNDNNGEDDDSETEKEVDIIFGEVDKVDDGAGNTDDEDDFDWNASETVRV
jgi:hypothetical protein